MRQKSIRERRRNDVTFKPFGALAIRVLSEANALDTWIGHFDLGRTFLEASALTLADSEFD